jgi:membrane associated rhomboid family serine protease
MGIHDRDYYRRETARSIGAAYGVSFCNWLVAINVIVFVLQVLTVRWESGVTEWLELDPRAVVGGGQIWRLVTAAFCHDPGIGQALPWHLILNLLLLWWFGRDLEQIYGRAEFLAFYLAAAVVSSLAFLGLSLVLVDPSPMIGASGAVMGVMILFACHYPHRQILLFFVWPVPIRWLVFAYVLFDLHPVLLALGGVPTGGNIAHAAHLGGFAFGYLYQRFHWRVLNAVPRFSVRRRRRVSQDTKLRVVRDEPEFESDFDKRVDELLAKVSKQGMESLSSAERSLLMEASRRYRNR